MSNHSLTVEQSWKELFADGKASVKFEKILPDYLQQMSWFGANTGNIKQYATENAPTYEMNSRPDWVIIPLKGIIQILKND